MVLDARDLLRQWREDSRGVDLDAIMQNYCDGYDDYEGENFYSDDEDEMSMSLEETVMKNAEILADEKKKSDMSGTRLDTPSNFRQHTGGTSMDSQVILHHRSGDEEKVKMDIEGGASEENKATEGKKKEKRKLQEDGVESEQKDGTETAIEVKKKKDSVSKSDA
ncbi:hypothetical protein MKW92_034434 [Papaver armeniacum]|nr:hypothetical protein MKW92_034434 [Papaver armeniacum]